MSKQKKFIHDEKQEEQMDSQENLETKDLLGLLMTAQFYICFLCSMLVPAICPVSYAFTIPLIAVRIGWPIYFSFVQVKMKVVHNC